MKQGELWSLNLDPVKGREQSGFRPAVIVSGNLMNRYLDVVMVCPLTSKVKNYKGNIRLNPRLVGVESVVSTFFGDEVIVRAALGYFTVFDH